jgi:hypothetical protein
MGMRLEPGWLDDDEEHIKEHTDFKMEVERDPDAANFSPHHLPLLDEHIDLHDKQRAEKFTPGAAPGATPEAMSGPENAADQLLGAGGGPTQGATPGEQASAIINPTAAAGPQ